MSATPMMAMMTNWLRHEIGPIVFATFVIVVRMDRIVGLVPRARGRRYALDGEP